MPEDQRPHEQVLQRCIQELCEIAEPEAAQKWFSRWIRSVKSEVEFTNREAELRESLSAIGPNEPKIKDVMDSREQYAMHLAGLSAVKQHGDTVWKDETTRKLCESTIYTLSMKGPLNEGTV